MQRDQYREALKQARENIFADFSSGVAIETLLQQFSDFIDNLLQQLWHSLPFPADSMALLAVGGYGRRALFPYSDIDFIILHANTTTPDPELVGEFLTTLWDIGLEPSHKVLSPDLALIALHDDLEFYTSLLDQRWVIAPNTLKQDFAAVLAANDPHTNAEFVHLKQQELRLRYAKFGDTASQLEPNIKQSPGGLRDIQTLNAVTQKLQQPIDKSEAETLNAGFNLLAKLRFGLQMLTHKREERLLFAYQVELARNFGFNDNNSNEAVLLLMQNYFRNAHAISALVRMLLQQFANNCQATNQPHNLVPINKTFCLIDGWLEATSAELFSQNKANLLEIFYLLSSVECKGIGVNTLRQIHKQRNLLTPDVANSSECRAWFKKILGAARGVSQTLNTMHDCGILERIIVDFGLIVGKMQYDFYHSYTVDSHILRVVARLEQFGNPDEITSELCAQIWARIPKRELLFIAALFHDLAKGRGGDHSALGKDLALKFCQDYAYSAADTQLITWLVEQHLLLSLTAQRKDITDPQVITQFAAEVGNQQNLDHLYLLTVADIQATNPKLWNSWRSSLLHRLYLETLHVLNKALLQPQTRQDLINNKQSQALQTLTASEYTAEQIKTLWQHWGAEYFLQNSVEAIIWHTSLLLKHNPLQTTIIETCQHTAYGVTEIFVSAPRSPSLFAIVATIVDQLDLNIVSATLSTSALNYSLDNYYVLETNGSPITETERILEIKLLLQRALQQPQTTAIKAARRKPRALQHFRQPAHVFISPLFDAANLQLNIIAHDSPGLLGLIASQLAAQQLNVLMAKINTLGERVEDVFTITPTHKDAALLTSEQLQKDLCAGLAVKIDEYLAG